MMTIATLYPVTSAVTNSAVSLRPTTRLSTRTSERRLPMPVGSLVNSKRWFTTPLKPSLICPRWRSWLPTRCAVLVTTTVQSFLSVKSSEISATGRRSKGQNSNTRAGLRAAVAQGHLSLSRAVTLGLKGGQ